MLSTKPLLDGGAVTAGSNKKVTPPAPLAIPAPTPVVATAPMAANVPVNSTRGGNSFDIPSATPPAPIVSNPAYTTSAPIISTQFSGPKVTAPAVAAKAEYYNGSSGAPAVTASTKVNTNTIEGITAASSLPIIKSVDTVASKVVKKTVTPPVKKVVTPLVKKTVTPVKYASADAAKKAADAAAAKKAADAAAAKKTSTIKVAAKGPFNKVPFAPNKITADGKSVLDTSKKPLVIKGPTRQQVQSVAADVLLGKASWMSAKSNVEKAISGKKIDAKTGATVKASVWDRIKSGASAAGDALWGTAAVVSTAAMAVPVVGWGVKGATTAAIAARTAATAKAAGAAGKLTKAATAVGDAGKAKVLSVPKGVVSEAKGITKGVVKAEATAAKKTASDAAKKAAATKSSKAATKVEIQNEINAAKKASEVKIPDDVSAIDSGIVQGAENLLSGKKIAGTVKKEPSFKFPEGFGYEGGTGTGGMIRNPRGGNPLQPKGGGSAANPNRGTQFSGETTASTGRTGSGLPEIAPEGAAGSTGVEGTIAGTRTIPKPETLPAPTIPKTDPLKPGTPKRETPPFQEPGPEYPPITIPKKPAPTKPAPVEPAPVKPGPVKPGPTKPSRPIKVPIKVPGKPGPTPENPPTPDKTNPPSPWKPTIPAGKPGETIPGNKPGETPGGKPGEAPGGKPGGKPNEFDPNVKPIETTPNTNPTEFDPNPEKYTGPGTGNPYRRVDPAEPDTTVIPKEIEVIPTPVEGKPEYYNGSSGAPAEEIINDNNNETKYPIVPPKLQTEVKGQTQTQTYSPPRTGITPPFLIPFLAPPKEKDLKDIWHPSSIV